MPSAVQASRNRCRREACEDRIDLDAKSLRYGCDERVGAERMIGRDRNHVVDGSRAVAPPQTRWLAMSF